MAMHKMVPVAARSGARHTTLYFPFCLGRDIRLQENVFSLVAVAC